MAVKPQQPQLPNKWGNQHKISMEHLISFQGPTQFFHFDPKSYFQVFTYKIIGSTFVKEDKCWLVSDFAPCQTHFPLFWIFVASQDVQNSCSLGSRWLQWLFCLFPLRCRRPFMTLGSYMLFYPTSESFTLLKSSIVSFSSMCKMSQLSITWSLNYLGMNCKQKAFLKLLQSLRALPSTDKAFYHALADPLKCKPTIRSLAQLTLPKAASNCLVDCMAFSLCPYWPLKVANLTNFPPSLNSFAFCSRGLFVSLQTFLPRLWKKLLKMKYWMRNQN